MVKKKHGRRQKRQRPRNTKTRIRQQITQQLVTQAQAAWERRQFHQALDLYLQALKQDPANTELLVDLGRAYGLRRDFEAAEEYLNRAIRSDPTRAETYCMVARTYRMISRPSRAADCYRRAIEIGPDSPELTHTLLALAQICERHHQLDEAREAVDQLLACQPDSAQGGLLQAVLDRRSGKIASAESRLRTLITRLPVSSPVTSDVWYELGGLLDGQAEYDQAMEALLQAKETLSRQADRANREAQFVASKNQAMLESITPEHFKRWNNAAGKIANSPRSMAVLTGHPRSGTTLVEQILDSHPRLVSVDEHPLMAEEVFMPLGRRTTGNRVIPIPEMLDLATTDDLRAVRESYWKHSEAVLGEPVGDRMLLDKNPELTMLIPVINRVFPEMKILFALRDPRDVCLSCFMQKLPLNSVSANYLSLEGTANKYARVMRTWLSVREQTRADWMELRYEETVNDVNAQARRILGFLALPWDDRVLDFHLRARARLVRSPTYEAVTKPVHTKAIGRWKNYEKYFEPLMNTLKPFIEEFQYS